jgi:hypothetical protein
MSGTNVSSFETSANLMDRFYRNAYTAFPLRMFKFYSRTQQHFLIVQLKKSFESISSTRDRVAAFDTHCLNFLLTYLCTELSPSSEAANCAAIQGNSQQFYGTRRFIAVFTRALHWSLS